MRVAAWRRVEHYGEDLVADELLRGVSILGEIGEQLSVTVRWELAGKLVSENRMNEAVTIVEGAEIEYSEHVSIALALMLSTDSGAMTQAVISAISEMEEDGLLSVINGDRVPIEVRVEAARKLNNRDSIRHTDTVLNTFVEAADIEGMLAVFEESPSLAKVYPFLLYTSPSPRD